MEESKKNSIWNYNVSGIPLYLYIGLSVPIVIGLVTGSLGTDILSTLAMLFTVGAFFNQIGKHLPIWNKWIGGGSMMAIMAPSFLVYMGWWPEKYSEATFTLFDTMGFLDWFILLLMAGGILSVDRDILLKTLKRCGPVFAGTIIMGGIFGLVAGMLVGMTPANILAYYILPNLGGGNGAGAVPMSEIFEQVTGNSREAYYATALAILTLGSTIALIIGVLLNCLGDIKPSLTGDKTQLLRSEKSGSKSTEKKSTVKPETSDIVAGFLVAGGFYALACIFGNLILPSIGSLIIHPYAYLVLFLTLGNIFDLIPERFRAGTRALQKFATGSMGPIMFAGIGLAIMDFGEFVAAITLQNLFVTFMIILGIAVGAAVLGWAVGFYPIDSAIIVGLCCANRGGSADVVLLGATGRMELMPYAQVLSRLGGAIVLALSSAVFAAFF